MAFFKKYVERAETELLAEVRMAKELGIYPYFKELCGEQGPIVDIDGREVIMLGSNNYLGFTTDKRVKDAAKKAIDEYGEESLWSDPIEVNIPRSRIANRPFFNFIDRVSRLFLIFQNLIK